MSSSVIVVSEPEQLPETFLYRFDIVNTVNFVHYHYQYHTMSSFGDQIKNTSTGFVTRLYEITRWYSIMSLLRLRERGPRAHGSLARPTWLVGYSEHGACEACS